MKGPRRSGVFYLSLTPFPSPRVERGDAEID